MKKIWSALLGIVIVLIIISGIEMGKNGFDWDNISGVFYNDKDLTATGSDIDSFNRMNVSVSSASVTVIKSDNNKIEIKSHNPEQYTYSIDNGIFQLTQSMQNIKFHIGFNREEIIIYTTNPQTDVIIHSTSGSVETENLDSENMDLKSTSGSVHVNNTNVASLSAESSSGSIHLDTVKAQKITCKSSSGSNHLKNVNSDNASILCSSGDIHIESSTFNTVNEVTSSGSINCDGIDANGFSGNATSGSIKICGTLTGITQIVTSTGSVHLDLKGDTKEYSKRVHTNTGSIYVDGEKHKEITSDTALSNDISVQTTTGSVKININ